MTSTLFDKIWERHSVANDGEGSHLLFVDRHLLIEGSFHSFEEIAIRNLSVFRPELTFSVSDHYVPTRGRQQGTIRPEFARMIRDLESNSRKHGILHAGLGHPWQGIVHVVGPELGLTLPGTVVVCGDSHTPTHGAFGALALGLGSYEVAHVLATQTLWLTKPKQMAVTVEGIRHPGITAKDVALSILRSIGVAGGTGFILVYRGSLIEQLSMEERMTICNMSTEAGAQAGLIAPDDTTENYLRGRRFAPKGDDWDKALSDWRTLSDDPRSSYDVEIKLDASEIAPIMTWGILPEQAESVNECVPSPSDEPDPVKRHNIEAALSYMGLEPNTALRSIRFDRVFIGSCTNGRIEDLRSAAAILRGRQICIPTMIVPGSMQVKHEAEAEGLAKVFEEAGCEWLDPGCSMCLGANGDMLQPGERCASTTNRNFRGRQGPGGRTHLMSPAMAAAIAVFGRAVDVRDLC